MLQFVRGKDTGREKRKIMQKKEAEGPPKAVIFIGIQASGKSTFFKRNFSPDFVHINLDKLHTRYQEMKLLEKCLRQRSSFVVDNTNPTFADRKRYIETAKEHGYLIEGYFFQSIIKDCVERNSKRLGKENVPDKAIAYTSNRLEMPLYKEGFDRLYFVQIQNGNFSVEVWKENGYEF